MKKLFNLMLVATIGATSITTVNAKPIPSNAVPTTAKIQFNNQPVQEAKGFVIDGYTYVRGRDLADICNTEFLYDSIAKEVVTKNASEIATFDQERMDNELGAYQYNNENYLQIRKVMWYMLYRPEISYDNSTKVIELTEGITLGKETTRMTQEEYMASKYPNLNTNTTPNVINNNTGTNTNSNTNNNTNDTTTISNEITAQDIKDYNDELLRLVNEARVEAGVKPLTLNQELIEVATARADEMVELNYFSHTSPTYGDFRQVAVAVAGEKYSNKGMGENITKHTRNMESKLFLDNLKKNNVSRGTMEARITFSSWWNSQGHKDNMLNSKYGEMGASISYDDETKELVAVQMFIY